MKNLEKLAWCALGIVAVGTIACAIVHRRVIAAVLTGSPMPEPPAWHKQWHPAVKGAQ